MEHAPDCSCDVSFICASCQKLIDIEIDREKLKDHTEWVAACLKLIAEKLNVKLPEEP